MKRERAAFVMDESGYLVCLHCQAERLGVDVRDRSMTLGRHGARSTYYEVLSDKDARKFIRRDGGTFPTCEVCGDTVATLQEGRHERKRQSRQRFFHKHKA